ncbi:hypothetical protein FGE12_03795 [Aggregicoccus sp. 17bor-14]|uniref:hypothetical protein n=1 Tax=Myxococcaceae TaxID=31 RepID=UPI00129D1B7F|nr:MULTISPECIES: hypothetical protein [Myxococcaceae]MBF5041497.1 hypothetical protein [Simulacricoccus sp. 17bor-14]MRI87281.1 hypothetical protein [Aggregicoccus sp. 17bor-14]
MKTQKTKVLAAFAALVFTAGCGGGSLPTDDGSGVDPGPVNPQPNPPASATSLWPLTTGSTWTYAITEKDGRRYTKDVTVKGLQDVPNQPGVQAIQVESVQQRTPVYLERSWQQESGGLVTRLREEDHHDGQLYSVSVWSPATLKSISASHEVGWTYTQGEVTEKVAYTDGTPATSEPMKPYLWRIIAVNETVEVPAGKFTNAVHLQRDRTDKDGKVRDYWLVPGVGKVKEDGERLEELSSYSVKP